MLDREVNIVDDRRGRVERTRYIITSILVGVQIAKKHPFVEVDEVNRATTEGAIHHDQMIEVRTEVE